MLIDQNSKKVKKSYYEKLDDIVFNWFLYARDRNIEISGEIIKAKALIVAEKLKDTAFKVSNSWLDRWKKKHGITFKMVSGEQISADINAIK